MTETRPSAATTEPGPDDPAAHVDSQGVDRTQIRDLLALSFRERLRTHDAALRSLLRLEARFAGSPKRSSRGLEESGGGASMVTYQRARAEAAPLT